MMTHQVELPQRRRESGKGKLEPSAWHGSNEPGLGQWQPLQRERAPWTRLDGGQRREDVCRGDHRNAGSGSIDQVWQNKERRLLQLEQC